MMLRKIVVVALAVVLFTSTFSMANCITSYAAKKKPKYYQKKLIRYVKKHGRYDGSWNVISTEDNGLYTAIDARNNEIMFVGIYRDDIDKVTNLTNLSFKVGNKSKIDGWTGLNGPSYFYCLGYMKKVRINKFKKNTLSYYDTSIAYNQSSSTAIKKLRKFNNSFFPIWKILLKRAGVTFKKIGFKNVK